MQFCLYFCLNFPGVTLANSIWWFDFVCLLEVTLMYVLRRHGPSICCCSGGKCASNKPDLTRHASHPSCTKFFGCLPSLGDVLPHQRHSTQHGKQILPLTDTQGSLDLGGCIDQADRWIVIWKIVFATCPANGDSPGCEANCAERAYIPCLRCIVGQCCSTNSFVVAKHCSSWVCFLHSCITTCNIDAF